MLNFYRFKYYKRIYDLIISSIFIIPISIFLIPFLIIIWMQDFHSPFYISKRAGRYKKPIPIIKLRSMIFNADKSEISSTKKGDLRITKIGSIIRKFKLDELTQIYNVFLGHISLVGPRPNTFEYGVNLYTKRELMLLNIRPGITDISSIVFSDESEILKDSLDPDREYNKIIRPWKSKLSLFYIKNSSFLLDNCLIFLTIYSIIDRKRSLILLSKLIKIYGADKDLIKVCTRKHKIPIIKPPE